MTKQQDRRKRRWCVMDLITDHVTGKMRETLVWSNAFKACTLWAYCRFVNAQNFETMTIICGGIFLAHEIGSRVLMQRQQAAAATEPPKA